MTVSRVDSSLVLKRPSVSDDSCSCRISCTRASQILYSWCLFLTVLLSYFYVPRSLSWSWLPENWLSLFVMNMMREDTSQWVKWLETNFCSKSSDSVCETGSSRTWTSMNEYPWDFFFLFFSEEKWMHEHSFGHPWCPYSMCVSWILQSNVWKKRKQEEEKSRDERWGRKETCYNCPFFDSFSCNHFTLWFRRESLQNLVCSGFLSSWRHSKTRKKQTRGFHASGLLSSSPDFSADFSNHEVSHDHDGQEGCRGNMRKNHFSRSEDMCFSSKEMTNEGFTRQPQVPKLTFLSVKSQKFFWGKSDVKGSVSKKGGL